MKKFFFEYCGYGAMDKLDGVVIFETTEKKAIQYFKKILTSEGFQQKIYKVDFEDFEEPEELPILQPNKAYKGYYIEDSTCGWNC